MGQGNALLSQEGSMIETQSRSCEGWFPCGTTPRVVAKNATTLPS